MEKSHPIWKTVTLGQYPDVEGYWQALKERGVSIIAETDDIEISKEKTDVNLVLAYSGTGPVGNVVLGSSTDEILGTIPALGLKPCVHEVALALALILTNKDLEAGHLILGAPPRATRMGSPYVRPNPRNKSMLFFERDHRVPKLKMLVSSGNWSGLAFHDFNRPVPWVFCQ